MADAVRTAADEALDAAVGALRSGRDLRGRIVQIGAPDPQLAARLLELYPQSTLLVLESSEARREVARAAVAPDRVTVRPFTADSLEWWDLMLGAQAILCAFAFSSLNEARTQYLYKAAADRLEPGGELVIADTVRPMLGTGAAGHPLLHHLVWLRHAGLAGVDCVWLRDGCAVFGGVRPSASTTH